MRYKLEIGEDFPLSAEVIEAKTRRITEITRSAIAVAMVVAVILALIVTATFCAFSGEFQSLQILWAVVAAPLGCIIGYYFRGTGTNGKENHAGAA